jgi:hypothetical protein
MCAHTYARCCECKKIDARSKAMTVECAHAITRIAFRVVAASMRIAQLRRRRRHAWRSMFQGASRHVSCEHSIDCFSFRNSTWKRAAKRSNERRERLRKAVEAAVSQAVERDVMIVAVAFSSMRVPCGAATRGVERMFVARTEKDKKICAKRRPLLSPKPSKSCPKLGGGQFGSETDSFRSRNR